MAETLVIEPKKKGGKGRRFRVALFSFVTANRFWESGTTKHFRPIYITYAGTDQEVRAFTANLRTGRPAIIRNRHGHDETKRLEIPRSSGLKFSFQRMANGITVATGYLPGLCDLDPGLMPERVTFFFGPPTWWVDAQVEHPNLQKYPPELRRDMALGGYFAAFVDRRSPFPIINDPLFHRRLFLEARRRPWFFQPSGDAFSPGGFFVYPREGNVPPIGLEMVGMISVSHDEFAGLVRSETNRYFKEETADWLYAPEPEPEPVSPAASIAALPPLEENAPAAPLAVEIPADLQGSPEIVPDAPDVSEEPPAAELVPEAPAPPIIVLQEERENHGETGIPCPGGVLPAAKTPDRQLSLFDFL